MNLRVSNIVMTGRLPFKHKINFEEMNRLVTKAGYQLINEESSPIMQKRIPILSRGKNVNGRQKGWCISLWSSGAVNFVGLLKRKEGKECYEIVLKDVKRYCRRVLK